MFWWFTFDPDKELLQVLSPVARVLFNGSVDDLPDGDRAGLVVADQVGQVGVQPLVQLDQVRQELSAGLQSPPLEGEAREEGNVFADHVARAEDTVSEVLLGGVVRVA